MEIEEKPSGASNRETKPSQAAASKEATPVEGGVFAHLPQVVIRCFTKELYAVLA